LEMAYTFRPQIPMNKGIDEIKRLHSVSIYRLWGRRCDNLYSPTPAGTTGSTGSGSLVRTGSPGSGSLGWTSLVSRSTTLTDLGGPGVVPAGRWPHTDEVYGFRYIQYNTWPNHGLLDRVGCSQALFTVAECRIVNSRLN
jgi:hypothetical protein